MLDCLKITPVVLPASPRHLKRMQAAIFSCTATWASVKYREIKIALGRSARKESRKSRLGLVSGLLFRCSIYGSSAVHPKGKTVHSMQVYFPILYPAVLLRVFDLVTVYVFFCRRALRPVVWKLTAMPSSPATSERPSDATATGSAPFPHSQCVITEL